ncbi:MAG TPA: hypothetical protein VGV67_01115, partial [Solirubrobacteraceae bacterium]|nr:hypothetical protein [Solirubrobacteraceae bacterium]
MRRVATTVTRHPLRVVLVWLAVAVAVIGLTGPGGAIERADVMESEQAEFLPDSYESVRAAQLEQAGFPSPDGATATLVVRRADRKPLTRANVARAARLSERVGTTEGVRAAVVDQSGLSPNRKVLL